MRSIARKKAEAAKLDLDSLYTIAFPHRVDPREKRKQVGTTVEAMQETKPLKFDYMHVERLIQDTYKFIYQYQSDQVESTIKQI